MNALELADFFDGHNGINLKEASAMLRQQHAKIEAYKERVAFLEAKCMIVDPINDKDYPFMKIMKGNKNED